MMDRAFFIKPVYKRRLFGKKLVGYKVSDGYNVIELKTYDYFLIYTDLPITSKVLRNGRA